MTLGPASTAQKAACHFLDIGSALTGNLPRLVE